MGHNAWISLNVNPDLSFYDGIIPCGIFHYGVTSMEKQLQIKQDMQLIKTTLIKNFKQNFKRD